MRCSLRIKQSAAKALASLPKVDRERLVEAIDLLCDTPAAGSALKGEFEGLRLQQLTVVSADRALARCAESLGLPLHLVD
jgi:hypothetical protein